MQQLQEIELKSLLEKQEQTADPVKKEDFLQHESELLPDDEQQKAKAWQEDVEVKFIIHEITPMDTLTGLSLQYGVTTRKIKNFNELDGDDIYFLKNIKIPNPKTNYQLNFNQEDYDKALKQQKIDFFRRNVMTSEDNSDKMARYYLEEAEWNEQQAASDYSNDLKWEKEHNEGLQNSKLVTIQNLVEKKNQ